MTASEQNRRYRLKHPWYVLYWGAKRRCEDPKSKSYKYCGALGIKFLMTQLQIENLFNWDGGHFMKTPSLDRIDASGNYTLANCRVIEKAINERRPHIEEWSD